AEIRRPAYASGIHHEAPEIEMRVRAFIVPALDREIEGVRIVPRAAEAGNVNAAKDRIQRPRRHGLLRRFHARIEPCEVVCIRSRPALEYLLFTPRVGRHRETLRHPVHFGRAADLVSRIAEIEDLAGRTGDVNAISSRAIDAVKGAQTIIVPERGLQGRKESARVPRYGFPVHSPFRPGALYTICGKAMRDRLESISQHLAALIRDGGLSDRRLVSSNCERRQSDT